MLAFFVKDREKAGVIRPKGKTEKGPLYEVVELNRPRACLLLALIKVIETEQERPKITI